MTTPQVGTSTAPVIVLTAARSGSTLLRLILDTHPALACPAHTNVMSTCAGMVRLARQLGPAGAELPGEVVAGIRDAVDVVYADFLHGTGKRRWCDKSLGSARFVREFLSIYPDAAIICLYRHGLDVIDSGIEASPWGVDGYGFDRFVAAYPTDSVQALAEYWVSTTRQILRVEKEFTQQCHRMYYEDLVADPEGAAADLFGFLGEPVVPGITSACFGADHGPAGPGDHKIWATDRVVEDSVGRGSRIPVGRLPDRLRARVQRLLVELGYPPLGEAGGRFGRTFAPADDDDATIDTGLEPTMAGLLESFSDHLRHRLKELPEVPAEWLQLLGRKPIELTIRPTRGRGDTRHWLIDLDPLNVTLCPTEPAGAALTVDVDSETVSAIMTGRLNAATAVLQGRLRLKDLSVEVDQPLAARRRHRSARDVARMRLLSYLLTTGDPWSTPGDTT